jgi:hypothetical protein
MTAEPPLNRRHHHTDQLEARRRDDSLDREIVEQGRELLAEFTSEDRSIREAFGAFVADLFSEPRP